LPRSTDPNLIVGYATSDDAGVYRLSDGLALVQTVDFFTPIVDDPYDFGRIAAANSLSDVYAMGARPLLALNVVTFPIETLPLDYLTRILEGGAAVAAAAGVTILGGHTVKDPEPKYGMAVTGTADPSRIVTNAGARPGDTLLLTKPLGTGILSTALKRGLISADRLAPVVEWMVALNAHASHAMLESGAHAATDITGYGLLGHAGEMARASGVRLRFSASAIPLHDDVLSLIDEGIVPGGTKDNAQEHASYTIFEPSVGTAQRIAFSDAQTSGGLLIAVPSERVDRLREILRRGPALDAVVGRVEEGSGIIVGD